MVSNDFSFTPTGFEELDDLLSGGYIDGEINCLYGPNGVGKTFLCIIAMIRVAGRGDNIIYVDSDSSFSVSRLESVTDYSEEVLGNCMFFRPDDFGEQSDVFDGLSDIVGSNTGLVIVDSISGLYKVERSKGNDYKRVNSEFIKQFNWLTVVARKNDIPVLVTADGVKSDGLFLDVSGGDIVRKSSNCLVELSSLSDSRKRASVIQHPLNEGKSVIWDLD